MQSIRITKKYFIIVILPVVVILVSSLLLGWLFLSKDAFFWFMLIFIVSITLSEPWLNSIFLKFDKKYFNDRRNDFKLTKDAVIEIDGQKFSVQSEKNEFYIVTNTGKIPEKTILSWLNRGKAKLM